MSAAPRDVAEKLFGFRLDRDTRRMPLSVVVDPPETLRVMQEETFADHEDHSPISYEDWRFWSFQEPFDPELWFLAFGDRELQGICLCRPEWDGDPSFGWVSVLGVRRLWRRHGLGLALLRHAFRELRARGKTRVGLGVDAENETGAVQLYERAGMEVARRRLCYQKALG